MAIRIPMPGKCDGVAGVWFLRTVSASYRATRWLQVDRHITAHHLQKERNISAHVGQATDGDTPSRAGGKNGSRL